MSIIPIKEGAEVADKIADAKAKKQLAYLIIIILLILGFIIRQLWVDRNEQNQKTLDAANASANVYKELWLDERSRRQESDKENKQLWSEKNNDAERIIESNDKVIHEVKKISK